MSSTLEPAPDTTVWLTATPSVFHSSVIVALRLTPATPATLTVPLALAANPLVFSNSPPVPLARLTPTAPTPSVADACDTPAVSTYSVPTSTRWNANCALNVSVSTRFSAPVPLRLSQSPLARLITALVPGPVCTVSWTACPV